METVTMTSHTIPPAPQVANQREAIALCNPKRNLNRQPARPACIKSELPTRICTGRAIVHDTGNWLNKMW